MKRYYYRLKSLLIRCKKINASLSAYFLRINRAQNDNYRIFITSPVSSIAFSRYSKNAKRLRQLMDNRRLD